MESIKIIRELSDLKKELALIEGQSVEMSKARLFFSSSGNSIYVQRYRGHQLSLLVGHVFIESGAIQIKFVLKTKLDILFNRTLSRCFGSDWEQRKFIEISIEDIKNLANVLNQLIVEFGYYQE